MNKVSWPFVAIVGMVLGFLVAIFAIIPKSDATSRSALLAVVIAGANACVLWAVQHVNSKVETIAKQTNGHMTKLIEAKTQPDVSRETSPRHARPEEP